MKRFLRIISRWCGLTCRHRYLSLPIRGRRVCNACGEEFPVDYN